MMNWVFFGFLLGLRHALEADHIAAVMTLSVSHRKPGQMLRHALLWGLGHALMLGAFGGAVYALELTLSPKLASSLDAVVGVMMVLLGGRVLSVLIRDRIHIHTHRHGMGELHIHAHSHAGDLRNHDASRHDHAHGKGVWQRSLAVGMMHGLAGSAALVTLTAATAPSVPLGASFIALFGIGTVAGMGLFSAVIAVPLSWSAATLTWATRGIEALTGLCALGVGLHILMDAVSLLLA